jgi:hypothetical protein
MSRRPVTHRFFQLADFDRDLVGFSFAMLNFERVFLSSTYDFCLFLTEALTISTVCKSDAKISTVCKNDARCFALPLALVQFEVYMLRAIGADVRNIAGLHMMYCGLIPLCCTAD